MNLGIILLSAGIIIQALIIRELNADVSVLKLQILALHATLYKKFDITAIETTNILEECVEKNIDFFE